MSHPSHVHHLKETAPYINAHRGNVVVIHLCAAALKSQLDSIIHEICLLHSLDIKIVLVFDAGIITDTPIPESKLPELIANIASLRVKLESRLTMGLTNSPMQGAHIKVSSGNMVIAKPKGIIDGIDYEHAGLVRKVRHEFVSSLLIQGSMVIIPPTGYSPSGEVFHVDSIQLAELVAASLSAYKLIYLSDGVITENNTNTPIKEWLPKKMDDIDHIHPEKRHLAKSAYLALRQGVARVHILNFQQENALLQELFTRDGSGTLVGIESYETLRVANTEDVAGIISLIKPLEASGILVKRSRELIESEVKHFSVIARDKTIIGCASLHTFYEKKFAEAACIAIHPDYKNSNRGKKLLKHLEDRAKTLGMQYIFVLTTQTIHWFLEQGYVEKQLEELPLERQLIYNYQRGSKILVKSLTT